MAGLHRISYLWKEADAAREYSTAVSLHSHTNQSKETLDFLANLGTQYPFLRPFFRRCERRARDLYKIPLNYAVSYWTPPLTPKLAFDLETGQIRQKLGLTPLVSITDHDTIAAPMLLRTMPSARHIPVSVEWSAPFGGDQAFHLGIHNLPSAGGRSWMKVFEEYTAHPDEKRLTEILAALHALPDVLIVFNHPVWDLYLIGADKAKQRVNDFLTANHEFIHAFELNGLRNWSENRAVKRLARQWNKLLISGGDRHGLEPNANVNLTNAGSFAEFVHEIRREHLSRVLFLPQYRESIATRYIHFIWQAVRTYPEMQGRERWVDRIFFEPIDQPGVIRPITAEWTNGGPAVVRGFISTIGFLAAPHMRGALRLAFGRQGEVSA